jgi:hypothetical protein
MSTETNNPAYDAAVAASSAERDREQAEAKARYEALSRTLADDSVKEQMSKLHVAFESTLASKLRTYESERRAEFQKILDGEFAAPRVAAAKALDSAYSAADLAHLKRLVKLGRQYGIWSSQTITALTLIGANVEELTGQSAAYRRALHSASQEI